MPGAAHLPSGAVESLLHGGELRADKLLLAQLGSGLLQVLVGLNQPGREVLEGHGEEWRGWGHTEKDGGGGVTQVKMNHRKEQ